MKYVGKWEISSPDSKKVRIVEQTIAMTRGGYRGGALKKRPTLPHPILASRSNVAPNFQRSETIRRTVAVFKLSLLDKNNNEKLAPHLNLLRPIYLPIWVGAR